MSTTGKTARELQVMIMGKLRVKHPECDDVIAVLVTPAGGEGHWIVETTIRNPVSLDCQRAKAAIVRQLRRQHHLV